MLLNRFENERKKFRKLVLDIGNSNSAIPNKWESLIVLVVLFMFTSVFSLRIASVSSGIEPPEFRDFRFNGEVSMKESRFNISGTCRAKDEYMVVNWPSFECRYYVEGNYSQEYWEDISEPLLSVYWGDDLNGQSSLEDQVLGMDELKSDSTFDLDSPHKVGRYRMEFEIREDAVERRIESLKGEEVDIYVTGFSDPNYLYYPKTFTSLKQAVFRGWSTGLNLFLIFAMWFSGVSLIVKLNSEKMNFEGAYFIYGYSLLIYLLSALEIAGSIIIFLAG